MNHVAQLLRFILIASLLLFVYSGLIKWINFPIDPTILFFLLSISLLFVAVNKIGFSKPLSITLFLFFLLFVWVSVSCIYTLSEIYWHEKLLRSLISIPAFLLPIIILKRQGDFDSLRKIYLVLLIIGLVFLAHEYFENNLRTLIDNDPGDTKIPEYLNISIFLGTGSLFIFSLETKWKYVVIVLSILFIILLGARAPIAFLATSFLGYFFLRGNLNRLLLISGAIVIVIAFSSSLPIFDRLKERLSGVPLIGTTIDSSVGGRLRVYALSLNAIKQRPFLGTGLGGFSMAVYGTDEVAVIHNIFLEIWVELGLIGFFILIIFMLNSAINLFNLYKRNSTDLIALSLLCICCFQFLELLVSSKMEDWRVPLFWLGTSLAYYNLSIKKS